MLSVEMDERAATARRPSQNRPGRYSERYYKQAMDRGGGTIAYAIAGSLRCEVYVVPRGSAQELAADSEKQI